MPTCTICAGPLDQSWACQSDHPDHCHDCHQRNLSQGFDARVHAPPPQTLVLSPRDVAALVQYQQHVQRVVGTGPLLDLVTGEEAP